VTHAQLLKELARDGMQAIESLGKIIEQQNAKIAEQDRKIHELADELKQLQLKQAGLTASGW
jgi:cell division protein FtsB